MNLSWRAPAAAGAHPLTETAAHSTTEGPATTVHEDSTVTQPQKSSLSAFGAFGQTSSAFGAAGTSAFGASSNTSPFGGATRFSEGLQTANNDFEVDDEHQESGRDEFEAEAEQPSHQISTLEVLGDDSDARKKRFESSIADNRYLEVSSAARRTLSRLGTLTSNRGIVATPPVETSSRSAKAKIHQVWSDPGSLKADAPRRGNKLCWNLSRNVS